jgi:hypothetical protein
MCQKNQPQKEKVKDKPTKGQAGKWLAWWI